MFNRPLLLFILLLCGFINELKSQIDLDSLRKASSGIKSSLSYMIDEWVAADTLGGQIEFVDEGHQVIIEPRTHIHHYTFRKENDSMSVTGTAMNWPPWDCILIPKDEDTLEIKYFNFISDRTYDRIYYRK